MDLKKTKKLKRKLSGLQIQYRKFPPNHIYRSEDKDAPFDAWERVTKKPFTGETFKDRDAYENQKFYYYMFTDIDEYGNEGKPYESPIKTYTLDGKKYERTPENFVIGANLYWSINPDQPFEEWTKMFDKPIRLENLTFKCPVKEPFYMYSIYVNALGKEIGRRSDVKRVVPRP
jgi:hypothetical protein